MINTCSAPPAEILWLIILQRPLLKLKLRPSSQWYRSSWVGEGMMLTRFLVEEFRARRL